MKHYKKKSLALAGVLLLAANAQAVSTSAISPTISFTLTDVQLGGVSATELTDYEADGPVFSGSSFNEQFLFGGTGSTSGSSSSSFNGTPIDPNNGAGPLAVGDTFTLTLGAQATANTGFVNRDQNEAVDFSFLNYTDDGNGNPQTLTFLFDYALSYTTSLSNSVAGDQALVEFLTTIEVDNDGVLTTLDLFPQSTMNAVLELHFGTGTVTPSGTRTGSFAVDMTGSTGSFLFDATASTPTNINAVPLPAAVWLFGSGLLGLAGICRKNRV